MSESNPADVSAPNRDRDIEGADQQAGQQDSDLGADDIKARSNMANAGTDKVAEHGGPKGLEPTRYGDWEANGRCYDF